MNVFSNYKASDFLEFLRETGFIQNFINGKRFDPEKYLYPDKYDTLEELCKSLEDNLIGVIVKLSKALIRTAQNIVFLIRLLSFEFAPKIRMETMIELTAAFSYEIYTKRKFVKLELGRWNPYLEVLFGFLLSELALIS